MSRVAPGVLREEQYGVAIAIGNSAGLCHAIKNLVDNATDRVAMGERARRMFERRFDKAVALVKWQELLEKVAKEA